MIFLFCNDLFQIWSRDSDSLFWNILIITRFPIKVQENLPNWVLPLLSEQELWLPKIWRAESASPSPMWNRVKPYANTFGLLQLIFIWTDWLHFMSRSIPTLTIPQATLGNRTKLVPWGSVLTLTNYPEPRPITKIPNKLIIKSDC